MNLDAWNRSPTLVGELVTLRPMERSDREAIVNAAADGELWRLFYTKVPGPEQIDAYLDAAEAERAAGRSMPFVVVRDGTVVGATRYMRMNPAHRRLEIGSTFYAASTQRTGVNTEAKLLLLTHAFDVLEALCVQLRTDRFNQPSRRAIERIGAQLDGILRAHQVMPDGRSRDTVVYSITRNDWPGVRTHLQHLRRRT